MKESGIRAEWRGVATRFCVGGGAVLVVGWMLDAVWIAACLGLLAYLAWHLWNLYRLDRWLRTRRKGAPPEAWGVWAAIFDSQFRRQRESDLRRRRLANIVKEFRDATNALPDAVVVLNNEFQIRWFNPSAGDLLGLRKRLDFGRPVTNLIRDPAFRTWLKSGWSDPNGLILASPLDESIQLRLRMFGYGARQRILLARDITEIQRIERMRKDFVANVSHELRTPLTVVSGYVETMAQEIGPEWQPVVRRLEQQSIRMKAIVEDLLTLSRLDATRELEDESVVGVDSMLEGLLAEARVLSDGRHRIELDSEKNLGVLASLKDLRSAFMNLITNAVRYTPDGGHIWLSWRSVENGAEFSVRDDGPGIASQHLPRLTERFYRVSSDRSRNNGGTGLGLAIVKNILALHEAELVVTSEPGRGSEFVCRFPLSRVQRSLSQAS